MNKMIRTDRINISANTGMISAFAFVSTVILGIGIVSLGTFLKIAPFVLLIFMLIFVLSKGGCCSKKRQPK